MIRLNDIRHGLILMGLIVGACMIWNASITTSAQCDVDGSPSNQGNNSANVIVCDPSNDPAGANVRGRNGNDSITVEESTVAGTVRGDGGQDTIIINGTTGNVQGNGGQDDITINGTASTVQGGGGQDNIVINGTADEVRGNNSADTIIINGVVVNDVLGGGGGDTIIIQTNASIGGTINGNGGSDTLRFDMMLCDASGATVAELNSEIEAGSASDNITIDGVLFQWVSIATLEGNIVPVDCTPVVVSEPEAPIIFTDGRLNGVMCPIWVTGESLIIYGEDGSDGIIVNVASVTGTSTSNQLLASNTNNTVRVYQLSSGEIQVDCDIWDSYLNTWKTDSYIFQSFGDFNPQVVR